MAIERDFKGIWIPKEIWLDSNLTWSEKMLLVEIDSLATLEKGCICLLYTSPSPRDRTRSRMPSSA